MSAQSKPLTWLSLQAIVPQMKTSKRIWLSFEVPVVDHICKKLPVNIGTLRVDREEIRIDDVTFKFQRLMSFNPTEKTEFIQVTINDKPTLIRTKATVPDVIRAFQDRMLGICRAKVGTFELGYCIDPSFRIEVENLKILERYLPALLTVLIDSNSFPLKSVEIMKWDKVPYRRVNTDVLIIPVKHGNWTPIFDAENYWIHLKSVSPDHSDAQELVKYIMEQWENNMRNMLEHWSFLVSTEFYNEFMKSIHRPGRFHMEILNREYTLQCNNEQTALKLFTFRNESNPEVIQLHLQFVEYQNNAEQEEEVEGGEVEIEEFDMQFF